MIGLIVLKNWKISVAGNNEMRTEYKIFMLQIAGHIPELLQRLKDENSASSQECEKEIAELTYCLMYQHAGYPEIYEPVLGALKVIVNLLYRY